MQCTKPFTEKDVIILNGNDEDFEKMKANMEERRANAKLAKKNKKKKSEDESEPKAKAAKKSDSEPKQKAKEGTKGKQKSSINMNGAASNGLVLDKRSVQKDPKASEVYKSLFTSSDEAKKQNTQHSGWVSFNPQYFR